MVLQGLELLVTVLLARNRQPIAAGRRRCAARGARGGAAHTAVGAAREGLRGDREAQGASTGCVRVRGRASMHCSCEHV